MTTQISDHPGDQPGALSEPTIIHKAAELYRASTILIVDDNPTNLTVISDYLKAYGFHIVIARSGESALEQTVQALPDIILLDVIMSDGLDGIETCRRLKANETTQDIPVIFMTALDSVESKIKGFGAGAVDYITRPFQYQEILVRITTHLRNRDLTRSLQKQNMRLEISRQVAKQVTSILDVDKLLAEIVRLIRNKFGYYFVSVWLLNDPQEHLIPQAWASRDDDVHLASSYTIMMGKEEGIISWVGRTGQHYLANDVNHDRRYTFSEDLPATQAELALPLRIGSTRLGVLDIQADEIGAFSFEDRMVLQTLADQIAIAIRNAQFYAEQQALHRLEEARARELADLNAAKDKFFSIVAHDLRGPFQPLLGFSKLLLRITDTATPEQLHEIGGGIYRSAKNIYDLLENLLQWSRLQMDRLDFEPEQIDLQTVVERNIRLLSENAAKKEVTLQSSVRERVAICADENMLDTVIRNLISNALKFTPDGGRITISAQVNGTDKIEISVADTGLGISPENIAKLFRLDAHHSTLGTAKEQGTGLGLLICKEMVEKNGGRIWIESEVGQGTTVHFTARRTAAD